MKGAYKARNHATKFSPLKLRHIYKNGTKTRYKIQSMLTNETRNESQLLSNISNSNKL